MKTGIKREHVISLADDLKNKLDEIEEKVSHFYECVLELNKASELYDVNALYPFFVERGNDSSGTLKKRVRKIVQDIQLCSIDIFDVKGEFGAYEEDEQTNE